MEFVLAQQYSSANTGCWWWWRWWWRRWWLRNGKHSHTRNAFQPTTQYPTGRHEHQQPHKKCRDEKANKSTALIVQYRVLVACSVEKHSHQTAAYLFAVSANCLHKYLTKRHTDLLRSVRMCARVFSTPTVFKCKLHRAFWVFVWRRKYFQQPRRVPGFYYHFRQFLRTSRQSRVAYLFVSWVCVCVCATEVFSFHCNTL